MALVMTPQHLELRKRDEPKLGGIFVDLSAGRWHTGTRIWRRARRSGGSRRYQRRLSAGCVVDATAGLGRDAFVLASVGLPRADAGA